MIQHRLGIAAARNATLAATVLVSTSHGAEPWKQVGEFEAHLFVSSKTQPTETPKS